MKFKHFLIGIVVLIGLLALSLGMGWFNVFYTGTVGKAQQNVERKVFEQTQSYVEGKRQEALKYYQEYLHAKTPEDKNAIKQIVIQAFANFDETKLSYKLQVFVNNCKYK